MKTHNSTNLESPNTGTGIITLPPTVKRLSVEDAITLVVDAKSYPGGVNYDGLTALERNVSNIEEKFKIACAKLNIVPRNPDDPFANYEGTEDQTTLFEISIEELQRYAAAHGVSVNGVVIDQAVLYQNDADKNAVEDKKNISSKTHRTVPRQHALDHVIQIAKDQSSDPKSYLAVWPELLQLAQAADRPAPVLGYVDGEGVKYQGNNDVIKFFTKDALRKKMQREAEKAQ